MQEIKANVQLVGEAHLSHSQRKKKQLGRMRQETRKLSANLWESLVPFHHIMVPFVRRMRKKAPGSSEHNRIRREMENALIARDMPGEKAAKMLEVLGNLKNLNDTIIDFRKMTISIAQKPIKWHKPDLFLIEHNFEGAHKPKVEKLKKEYAEYTKKVGNEFDIHDVDIFHELGLGRTMLRNIGILLETNKKVKSHYRKHGGSVNVSGVFGAAHISARLGPTPTLRALFHFQHLPVFFKNKVIKPLRELAKGPERYSLTKRGRDLMRLVSSTKNDEKLHKKLTHGIKYNVDEPIILLDEKILEHGRTLDTTIKDVEEAVSHVYDASLGGVLTAEMKEKLGDVDLKALDSASKKISNFMTTVKRMLWDYKDSMSRQNT